MTDFRYIDLKNFGKDIPPKPNLSPLFKAAATLLAATAIFVATNTSSKPHDEPSEAKKEKIIADIRRANTDLVHGIECWDANKNTTHFQQSPLGRPLMREYIEEVKAGAIVDCDVTEDFDGSLKAAHTARIRQQRALAKLASGN